MTDRNTLLPCPFCGGDADTYHNNTVLLTGCNTCGTSWMLTKAWNTRTQRTKPAENVSSDDYRIPDDKQLIKSLKFDLEQKRREQNSYNRRCQTELIKRDKRIEELEGALEDMLDLRDAQMRGECLPDRPEVLVVKNARQALAADGGE